MGKITKSRRVIGNKARQLCCLFIIGCYGLPSFSQIISVNTTQDLSFGAFTQGSSGGTVTLNTDGSRTTSGTVVGLSLGFIYHQAIFEVEASIGTIISITNGPDSNLAGSNGGSITLRIGNSDPNSPLVSSAEPPGKNIINVGGTLTIGDMVGSPPGSYTGSFYVTFNNE